MTVQKGIGLTVPPFTEPAVVLANLQISTKAALTLEESESQQGYSDATGDADGVNKRSGNIPQHQQRQL
jgi:hypothetical protein